MADYNAQQQFADDVGQLRFPAKRAVQLTVATIEADYKQQGHQKIVGYQIGKEDLLELVIKVIRDDGRCDTYEARTRAADAINYLRETSYIIGSREAEAQNLELLILTPKGLLLMKRGIA